MIPSGAWTVFYEFRKRKKKSNSYGHQNRQLNVELKDRDEGRHEADGHVVRVEGGKTQTHTRSVKLLPNFKKSPFKPTEQPFLKETAGSKLASKKIHLSKLNILM